MEPPKDLFDPFYTHLKADIANVITGPLSQVALSSEAALRKVRAHCAAEYGYSDELVYSTPEWQERWPADAPQNDPQGAVEPIKTLGSMPETETPQTGQETSQNDPQDDGKDKAQPQKAK